MSSLRWTCRIWIQRLIHWWECVLYRKMFIHVCYPNRSILIQNLHLTPFLSLRSLINIRGARSFGAKPWSYAWGSQLKKEVFFSVANSDGGGGIETKIHIINGGSGSQPTCFRVASSPTMAVSIEESAQICRWSTLRPPIYLALPFRGLVRSQPKESPLQLIDILDGGLSATSITPEGSLFFVCNKCQKASTIMLRQYSQWWARTLHDCITRHVV
jgi:hypothetical protein